MEKIEVSHHLNVSAEEVFDFIADPRKQPMVMPDLTEVSNLTDFPMKIGTKFNFVFQMGGRNLKGLWTVESLGRPSLYQGLTSGDIVSKWSYNIIAGEKQCDLTLTIEYEIPGGVAKLIPKTVVSHINTRVAETYLNNLEEILDLS